MVCIFLPILREKFCLFSSRALTTKYLILNGFKMYSKKLFFTRHTFEKNKHNFCFKIDKKLHTKHHQINQFLCFLTTKKQVRYFKKCLYMVGQYNKVYWTTIPVYNIKGAKYKLWWAYLLNKQKTSKIFQKVFVYGGGQYNKVYSSKSV